MTLINWYMFKMYFIRSVILYVTIELIGFPIAEVGTT